MLRNDELSLERYLSRLVLRSDLGPADRRSILDLPFNVIQHRAGKSFVSKGDDASAAYVVVSGLIASFNRTREGDRQIMALHIHGDMADLPSLMLDSAVSGLEALTDSSLLKIPIAALDEVRASSSAVSAALCRDVSIDAAIQIEWAGNVGRKDARARLAHLFCEMAARYEQCGTCVGLSFELPMTQHHMAEATALTPVHVNRMLRVLRETGIVEVRRNMIHVLDWPALIAAAEFDPSYLNFRNRNVH